jgi:predicted permease
VSWFGRFRRRAALDRDLERELQDHLERRTQALIAVGLSPAQAGRQARVESGGVEQVKEAVRDVRGTRWAHDVAQDVRYGVRSLLSRPGLLVAATLSLGLGLGANTAIFSLVDAVLLRNLPVRDPESLVMVSRTWTTPIWEQVRMRTASSFAGAAAWSADRFDLSRGGETDAVDGLFVSGTFFETLGVEPALGRLLTAADDRRGGGADGPTAVISHRFWQLRFRGDPAVLGRSLELDHVPVTIVGVVPARFLGPSVGQTFDVAVPIGLADRLRPGAQQSLLDGRSHWWLDVVFRLREGQTIQAAASELHSVQPAVRAATIPQRWGPADQASYLKGAFQLVPAPAGRSELRQQYRRPLLVLLGMVGVVLIVACANVANLLLARGDARRQELTARLALGASQGRLVRQLLTESVLLVLPGTVLALVLAVWGSRLLVTQLATSESNVTLALPVDWRLLSFLAALGLATGLAFGMVPAWRARRIDAADVVAHAVQTRVTRRGAVSGPLAVAQVALSLVLVVAAGLFGRTFTALAARDLGFQPEGLLQASLGIGRTPAAQRGEVLARVRDVVAGVPGVQAAGVSSIEPLGGLYWTESVDVPDAAPSRGTDRSAHVNAITPGWFATYGTPLLAGRDFDDRDRPGAPVAIVNAAFARHFFGAKAPIGQRIRMSSGSVRRELVEIVGVVTDAAYRELRGERPPTVYRPLSQIDEPFPMAAVTLRLGATAGPGLQPALTRAITGVDPTIAVTYRSVEARFHDKLGESRMIAFLAAFFGGLALLLAAIGLYGVTSYGVTERRREIGIRLTLGATRGAAERLVIARVVRLVGLGVAIGLAATLALSPIVRTLLYELEPRNPVTIAVATAILAITGLVAGWLPARRAARMDPAADLREGEGQLPTPNSQPPTRNARCPTAHEAVTAKFLGRWSVEFLGSWELVVGS